MKKLFTLITSFIVTSTIIAQTVYTLPFNEGFESGVIPSDWGNVDYDNDGNMWDLSDAASGSTCIGDFCVSSASWTGAPLTPDNFLILPAIDMGTDTTSTYELAWQVYAQDQNWVSEFYEVYVSTTGDSVNAFLNGTSVFSETLTTSTGYMARTIPMNQFVGDTVWIAFRHYNSTDWFRMNVDEISVREKPAIDFAINSARLETRYIATPDAQARPVNLTFEYTNNGIDTLTNVTVTANETNTAYTESFQIASILPGVSGSATFTTQFWGNAGAMTYDIDVSASVTGDPITSNDMVTVSYDVTDSLYSVADEISFFFTDQGKYANIYEVNQRDTLVAINTVLYNGTNSPLTPGNLVWGGLAELDGNGVPAFETAYTDTFTIQSTTDVLVPVRLNFPYNLNVEAGNYAVYVALDMNMLGQQDAVRYDANTGFFGSEDGQGNMLWDATENLYGGTYWFADAVFSSQRAATLDPDQPLDNIRGLMSKGLVNVYPNPAEDNFTVSKLKGFETVQLVDITGKTIKTIAVNGANSINVNVADLKAGVYFVKANNNETSINEKLIIK